MLLTTEYNFEDIEPLWQGPAQQLSIVGVGEG